MESIQVYLYHSHQYFPKNEIFIYKETFFGDFQTLWSDIEVLHADWKKSE